MEQNKLENQIREKLNSREIQPSAQAWGRLDAMLSVSEKKKPKQFKVWLYIAAGIVGFLFVGILFYNQENSIIKTNNQPVVDSNSINKSEKSEEIIPSSIKKQSEKNYNEVQEIIVGNASKKENSEKTTPNIQEINKSVIPNNSVVAHTIPEIKTDKTTINMDSSTSLASVENENQVTKINTKPKLQIDPKILLSQVDGEIELTFRQKVIKTINKNYDSAKQSLASRNQE